MIKEIISQISNRWGGTIPLLCGLNLWNLAVD